jgi:hypothetical protein
MNSLARTVAFAITFAASCAGCSELCGNEVVASVSSPSGAYKAVVFTRDCGATTGWSTQVSVLRGSEQLPNEGGNTLVLEGKSPVQVTWKSESALSLSGTSGGRLFKQERVVHGIAIAYE